MTAMTDWRKSIDLKLADEPTVVRMLGFTKFWIKDKKKVGETILDQYSSHEWTEEWACQIRRHRKLRVEL